jgi:hypothetical protein
MYFVDISPGLARGRRPRHPRSPKTGPPRTMTKIEMAAEALDRARNGETMTNYAAIFAGSPRSTRTLPPIKESPGCYTRAWEADRLGVDGGRLAAVSRIWSRQAANRFMPQTYFSYGRERGRGAHWTAVRHMPGNGTKTALRGWGGRIRTSMCKEKIHLFERAAILGFTCASTDPGCGL